jgi:GNAT superfamily N-acetyltransferase
MIGDWFRTIELPMAFSDFERLPRNPTYKYEFFGGRAVLTPRPRYQRAVLELPASRAPTSAANRLSGVTIRRLAPGHWASLPELLSAAFEGVPPLVTLDTDRRLDVARECVEHTRMGGDGSVVDGACFGAVDQSGVERLVGAILVTLIHEGCPHLTWVLVHPWHVRQGLGTALLAAAVTALGERGHRHLASTFLVGNHRATLWHWRRGFHLVGSDLLLQPGSQTADPSRLRRSG